LTPNHAQGAVTAGDPVLARIDRDIRRAFDDYKAKRRALYASSHFWWGFLAGSLTGLLGAACSAALYAMLS
jgi:hypothetical protein